MSTDGNSSNIGIECIQGGAKLNAYQVRRYELCAESLYVTKMKPPPEETVIFPPEITLHEHRVQWKLYDGNRFTHLELTCPPTSFCDNPAVTATLNHTTITLSSLTIPPTPTLASKFISDGAHLALWNSEGKLNLVCDSKESASSLNCTVNTDCECEPAENKVHCACTDVPITDIFENEVQNRFPVLRPWITFKPLEHDPTIATAYVPTFTTAEFIIHTKERFNKVVTDVTNSVCRVNNAIAKGCYQCPQGAESKIVCTTDGLPVMASIRCDDTHFTVPCSPEGAESTLRFVHTLARMRKVCDVNCGSTTTTFEITGILQWTRTIHSSAKKILMGESTLYDEFVLPDFGHIFDVLFEWYKTFFATMVVFVAAIVIGYLFIWKCSQPPTDWLKGSYVELDKDGFIKVDCNFKTTANNIYAIGDVVSAPLPLWNIDSINIQHLQTAQSHGQMLGYSILGYEYPHELVPFFWVTFFFEFGIQFSGCTQGSDQTIVHGSLEGMDFAKYFLKNDVVVAVASAGPIPTAVQFIEIFKRSIKITREDVLRNVTKDWMAWLNN
ncbi:hypothetical protein TELCIR_02740 [Teladorsagia circumcincta]|uniref:Pyridine nucleotide-disulfide oxidoreductase n=1 Tax=Teladorsagia circumcincta TaxID=45464 RepID=A0A2G9V0E0_TELCI|nr:hypothetical protein TELCIR_02740 [Teladorsagia circumcincta]